ncbi:cholecystokinin [Solea solea]|uniref:cholecystokinin n=1 Tax=Solea solea TaxID=90069 RepID=UPI00272DBA9E|nr:cholecystokinin [Solea solea]
MSARLCVCVVLAVLCVSCLGLPLSSQPPDEGQRSISPLSEALSPHLRQSRSAPQLKALPVGEDGDSRANLSELLARLISSRKAAVRRDPTANSRGSANHRIADRDYMGWMDFGRRSAEEYEYSS